MCVNTQKKPKILAERKRLEGKGSVLRVKPKPEIALEKNLSEEQLALLKEVNPAAKKLLEATEPKTAAIVSQLTGEESKVKSSIMLNRLSDNPPEVNMITEVITEERSKPLEEGKLDKLPLLLESPEGSGGERSAFASVG